MTNIPSGTNLSNDMNPARHSEKDRLSYLLTEESFNYSSINLFNKLEAFPRFATKRSISKFIVKYEIYKKIMEVNGCIIECGVLNGAGLFTWAQLANIFEPTNYNRKIIGFDTFEGFPNFNELDESGSYEIKIGDMRGDTYENLLKSVDKFNSERQLSHINNMELIRGDFLNTSQEFLENNKHLIVSMLYLDFDLYEPTKKALEVFLPRMGKGSIICFDELNCENFPGETLALLESLDIKKHQIQRFPIDPWVSYIVL